MLALPSSSSPLRSLFDVADLATLCRPECRAKLLGFRDCINSARVFFAEEAAVRSVNSICLRANGELWLVEIRRSGTWKKLWNFGVL